MTTKRFEEADGSITEVILHKDGSLCPVGSYEISPRKYPPLDGIDLLIIKTNNDSHSTNVKTLAHQAHKRECKKI